MTALLFFVAITVAANPDAASDSSLARVRETIAAARETQVTVDTERVIKARTELLAALGIVHSYVSQQQTPPLTGADRQRMVEQANEKSPDIAVLDTLLRAMFDDRPGLESHEMLSLRAAVSEYRDASYYAQLPDLQAAYLQALENLDASLQQYVKTQRAEDRIAVGAWTGWLARAQLAPDVVREVHARFSQPNNYLSVNVRLLQEGFEREVNSGKPVNKVVAGALVSGTAQLKGSTYAQFIPDAYQATIELGVDGRLVSDTVCSNGTWRTDVTVNSHTESEVRVARRIQIGDFIGQSLSISPAIADVRMVPEASWDDITVAASGGLPLFHGLRETFVYNAAQQRVDEAKAEGMQLTAAELEAEANQQQVPPDLQELLDQVAEIFQEFYIIPQTRSGTLARDARFTTTEKWLTTRHVRRTSDELAAPALPPRYELKQHDIAIRLHESEFSNVFNRRYGGKTVTDHDLKEFLENVRNYVPRPLRKGTHMAAWSMQLADEHPLRVDLHENTLEIAVRIAAVDIEYHPASGETGGHFAVPLECRATYQLVNDNHQLMGKRLDDVSLIGLDSQIDPQVRARLTSFLLPKMNALFMDEFYPDGLTAVRGGFFEPLTYLRLDEFRTIDGWLVMGWKLTESPAKVLEAAMQSATEGRGQSGRTR
jgi:hypothetical protein